MRRTLTSGSPALALDEAARRLGTRLDDTARSAARRFPLRFPAYYASLARAGDPADPIRLIGWPHPEETAPDAGAIADPVGEEGRRVHPLVIRKHADRVILLVTSRCHFYCRFCFRAAAHEEPRAGEIDDAIEALARLDGLEEVILSGGDPLVLPDAHLGSILDALGRVPGLARLRVHTRAPVHDPGRVTPGLARVLADRSPVPMTVVLHASHPRELTREFRRAVGTLTARGLPVLDQTVLLRGVNADADTLAALFRGLWDAGVRPYYLHHPDRVAGSARFRVTIEEGRRAWRAARARLSGPAVPHYVLDLPDGSGKIPVDWLERVERGVWRATLPDGRAVLYRDIDAAAGAEAASDDVAGADAGA